MKILLAGVFGRMKTRRISKRPYWNLGAVFDGFFEIRLSSFKPSEILEMEKKREEGEGTKAKDRKNESVDTHSTHKWSKYKGLMREERDGGGGSDGQNGARKLIAALMRATLGKRVRKKQGLSTTRIMFCFIWSSLVFSVSIFCWTRPQPG